MGLNATDRLQLKEHLKTLLQQSESPEAAKAQFTAEYGQKAGGLRGREIDKLFADAYREYRKMTGTKTSPDASRYHGEAGDVLPAAHSPTAIDPGAVAFSLNSKALRDSMLLARESLAPGLTGKMGVTVEFNDNGQIESLTLDTKELRLQGRAPEAQVLEDLKEVITERFKNSDLWKSFGHSHPGFQGELVINFGPPDHFGKGRTSSIDGKRSVPISRPNKIDFTEE